MITLRAKDMSMFLKRVHLGNIITECVLQTTPEGMHVIAVDTSNTLVAVVAAPFPQTLNIGNLGIAELPWFIKALDRFGDANVDLEVSGNRLTFRGASNTIKYLLAAPDAIGTMPRDPNNLITIKDRCCYSVKLDEANRSNLTTNIKLFNKARIVVNILDNNGKGSCVITCGKDTENQFTIQFGRVTVAEGSVLRPVSFEIDAAHVKEVLDATGSESEVPVMLMSDDAKYPVVISQAVSLWGFLPTAAGAAGEPNE